jgi:hypothetical protein
MLGTFIKICRETPNLVQIGRNVGRFKWIPKYVLLLLACWDCGFEFLRGHGCLSVVSVIFLQVEISTTGRSLVVWCVWVLSRSLKNGGPGPTVWLSSHEKKFQRVSPDFLSILRTSNKCLLQYRYSPPSPFLALDIRQQVILTHLSKYMTVILDRCRASVLLHVFSAWALCYCGDSVTSVVFCSFISIANRLMLTRSLITTCANHNKLFLHCVYLHICHVKKCFYFGGLER